LAELTPLFGENDLLGSVVGDGRLLFQPDHQLGNVELPFLIAQTLDQFAGERQRKLGVHPRQLSKGSISLEGANMLLRQNPFRPGCSFEAQATLIDHQARQASQVLDQPDTQHNRDCPDLTDRERRYRFICQDKASQLFEIDPTVGMLDQFERQRKDTRFAVVGSAFQFRKFVVVPAGQVLTNFADLTDNNVVVVHQPGSGRSERLALRSIGGERLVRQAQQAMIAIHRREQSARFAGLQNDRVFGGERPRAFFELPGRQDHPADRAIRQRLAPSDEGKRLLHGTGQCVKPVREIAGQRGKVHGNTPTTMSQSRPVAAHRTSVWKDQEGCAENWRST
jgi:hypothetical protein